MTDFWVGFVFVWGYGRLRRWVLALAFYCLTVYVGLSFEGFYSWLFIFISFSRSMVCVFARFYRLKGMEHTTQIQQYSTPK